MSLRDMKIQILFSLVLFLIVLTPHSLQIKYSITDNFLGYDITQAISPVNTLTLSSKMSKNILLNDMNEIFRISNDSVFIVGNKADDYQLLAHYYTGNKIKEFVSIQDYIFFS